MEMNSQTLDTQPWYRQGWPWFLFGLPALSVVIGITLYTIANTQHVDSIVSDDYTKYGKGVEIYDGRVRLAQSLGLSAHAKVREDSISVEMSAAQEENLPTVLRLTIIHPTQDRFDQHVLLQKGEDGVYSGEIKSLHASRWRFRLEDESRAWSMSGEANVPTVTEVSIKPSES
jgi:hypothetical protein